MAQFVTHIQPTLVEASHHHVPHHHHPKEPKEKEHHARAEHHAKEHQHHAKEHHHKGSHHFPVLPTVHRESHHDLAREAKEREVLSASKEGGSYMDSHGLQHAYQLKFIDSQVGLTLFGS